MTIWLMAAAISSAQLAGAPNNNNVPSAAEDGRNGVEISGRWTNPGASSALGQAPNTGFSSGRVRPTSYPAHTYPGRTYPRRTYAAGMGRPSGRRVLIGDVIGSLIGVAIGAKAHDGARGVATFAALGGAIGGGMGASTPP